jgi:sugar O-acyltransferase (sialic acid O-acetyltransferase NeuD family)
MENPVIIFGAKGQGLTALEIFQSNNNIVYCFLDDEAKLHGKEIHEISVLGSTDDDGFLKLIGKKCDAFVAIENSKQREMLTEMLLEKRKVVPVNAIHAKSYISMYAEIGHGNLISAGASIGADVKLGSHCVVNTNASIDTSVEVADFVQIGAGSVINSGAKIEQGVFIGSGVTVIAGVTIGKNARVGAGSVVMANVKTGQTVFGVPAVEVKN